MTPATAPNGIVLVRHASTSWSGRRYCGTSDPPLDAAGRATATELARTLAPTLAEDTVIVSSPSLRARDTAAAIVAALGRSAGSVVLDARWAEADCGRAEGRTFAELETAFPDLAARLARGATDIDWPDGETAAALDARVTAAWRDAVKTGRPMVIVSHAGPLRIALALGTGVSPDAVVFLSPGEARWLEVS